MREIKFKGKRIDNGEWVIGYYWFNNITSKHCIDFHNIIPETVGQFTGCLDKNGKEIYEGDIVQRRRYRFEVEDCYNLTEDEEYEQITETSHIIYTGHGFQPATEKFGYEGEELWNWRTMEVIGNIHENK